MQVTCATDSGDEKMRQFYFCRVTFFHLEVCHRITFAPFIIFFLDLFPFIFGCWELRDCQCRHRILSLYFFPFRLSVVLVTYVSVFIFSLALLLFSILILLFSLSSSLKHVCEVSVRCCLMFVRLRLHLSAQGKIIWSAFFSYRVCDAFYLHIFFSTRLKFLALLSLSHESTEQSYTRVQQLVWFPLQIIEMFV